MLGGKTTVGSQGLIRMMRNPVRATGGAALEAMVTLVVAGLLLWWGETEGPLWTAPLSVAVVGLGYAASWATYRSGVAVSEAGLTIRFGSLVRRDLFVPWADIDRLQLGPSFGWA
jgi:hypothetical protein